MQHTENYNLKLIETDDAFSPDALNQNAQALDAALAALAATVPKFACGTYTGNGSTKKRLIELPFTPKMVYVGDKYGQSYTYTGVYHYHGGLAVSEKPAVYGTITLVEIVEGGFQVFHSSSSYSTNISGDTFCYFAIG